MSLSPKPGKTIDVEAFRIDYFTVRFSIHTYTYKKKRFPIKKFRSLPLNFNTIIIF